MLSTVHFPCSLHKVEADALNEESGRVYSDMLVQHYRRYRCRKAPICLACSMER